MSSLATSLVFIMNFLGRNAFAGMNHRAIAMMFLCLSVWDGRTVHFSADLSLWLDSPMFWAP